MSNVALGSDPMSPQVIYVGIRWYVKGWRETRGYY